MKKLLSLACIILLIGCSADFSEDATADDGIVNGTYELQVLPSGNYIEFFGKNSHSVLFKTEGSPKIKEAFGNNSEFYYINDKSSYVVISKDGLTQKFVFYINLEQVK